MPNGFELFTPLAPVPESLTPEISGVDSSVMLLLLPVLPLPAADALLEPLAVPVEPDCATAPETAVSPVAAVSTTCRTNFMVSPRGQPKIDPNDCIGSADLPASERTMKTETR